MSNAKTQIDSMMRTVNARTVRSEPLRSRTRKKPADSKLAAISTMNRMTSIFTVGNDATSSV